jgi:hypothetical protein
MCIYFGGLTHGLTITVCRVHCWWWPIWACGWCAIFFILAAHMWICCTTSWVAQDAGENGCSVSTQLYLFVCNKLNRHKYRYYIKDSFVFGAPALIMHYTITFLLNWAMHVLIDGYEMQVIIGQLLINSPLGWHMTVIHMSGMQQGSKWIPSVKHYVWSNPTLHPNRQFLPLLCPKCRCYWSFAAKRDYPPPACKFHCEGICTDMGEHCREVVIFKHWQGLEAINQPPVSIWLVETLWL